MQGQMFESLTLHFSTFIMYEFQPLDYLTKTKKKGTHFLTKKKEGWHFLIRKILINKIKFK